MIRIVLLSVLISIIYGCMPGPSGNGELQPYELSNTPKFRFLYSPPISWTFSSTPEQGQANSAEVARETASIAINDAFKGAFVKISATPPADFKINTDELVPENIVIAADPKNAKKDEGIVELGVVSQVCKPTGDAKDCAEGVGLSPLSLNQTIFVQNGPLLSGNQWSEVANQVFITLSSVSNVYFQEELIAEKN